MLSDGSVQILSIETLPSSQRNNYSIISSSKRDKKREEREEEREGVMPQYKREQWVLAGRIRGAVAEENFRVSSEDVPEMRKGEILCRALYISIDPITRYNSSVFA